MKTALLLPLILSVAAMGCGRADRETLGPEWFPLRYVQQDTSVPHEECVTYRNTMRVRSLRWWRGRYVLGSVERKAVLSHERRHALRSYQVAGWLERYRDDQAFRLQEEQDAYEVQFEVLMAGGEQVDEVAFAHAMAGPWYDGMVDFTTAVTWADDTCRRLASVH